jgi:CheY-like chemotaxis protein
MSEEASHGGSKKHLEATEEEQLRFRRAWAAAADRPGSDPLDSYGPSLRGGAAGQSIPPHEAMMRAIGAGDSMLSEPVLQPTTAQVSWQPGLPLPEPPADPSRPITVLLVDDNHHHRIPLVRALRERKYNVLYAAASDRGEDLFRTSLHEIDALVACSEMKRMGGFELARRVRRASPEIGVLLMCTHFASPEETHRALEHRYALIEEPFTPEQLCRRLIGVVAPSRHIPRALQS